MDGWTPSIASVDDRPADEIEHADPALAGAAAQAFVENRANHMYIYATNIPVNEGTKTVFATEDTVTQSQT